MEAKWKRFGTLPQFWWTDRNNLLEFHFHRQPKPSLFVQHQMHFYKLLNSCCFKFQPGHFFAPEQWCWTLDESHGNAFSRLAKALQQFLRRKPRCWAILEKYRRCRLFLCVAAIAVLLCYSLATKQLYAFLFNFTAEQSHLWYVWLVLLQKCFK